MTSPFFWVLCVLVTVESTKADTDTSLTMMDDIGNAEVKNKDEELVIIESKFTSTDEKESIDATTETIDGMNDISSPNVLEQTQEEDSKNVNGTTTDDVLNITETSTAYDSYQQQQQQSRRRRKVFGSVSIDNCIADSRSHTTPHSSISTNVLVNDQSIKTAFQDILTLATPKSPQYDNERHVKESITNDDDSCSSGHERDMEKINGNDGEDDDEIETNEEMTTTEDDKDDSPKNDDNENKSEKEIIQNNDDQLSEMILDTNAKETDLTESCVSENIQNKRTVVDPEMEQVFANEGELDEDAVLQSTEYLFSTVTDKLTVTVKDIVQSLCAEYNVKKLGKKLKNAVRQRLIELIEEEQNADTNETSEKENDSVDGQSNKTDDEQNSHYNDEDASNGTDDDVVSGKNRDDDDFDPVEEGTRSRRAKSRRKRVVAKKRRQSTDSGDDGDDDEGEDNDVGDSIGTNRKPRKINMKIKKSALRIHHEQLRKRRLEELRVRNEELQVLASKKDQERAELIAAKFDTNRTEMRLQRLENRLDLLQKLDQQRIKCISATPPTIIQPKCQVPVKDEKECKQPIVEQLPLNVDENLPVAIESKPSSNADIELDNGSDSDDEDDDDLELVLIDGTGNELKATGDAERKQMPEECNHIMSILDLADQEPYSSRFNTKPKHRMSPRRCVNARAQLRQQLLSKQRSMGNEWLARELGYKSQEDHLRDCQEAEEKKREMTIKREEIRIKENERRLLRERMIKLDQQQYEETNFDDPNNNDDEDEDDPVYTPDEGNKDKNPNQDDNSIEDEDDDEELQLAKIISEQQKTIDKLASDTVDESIPDESSSNEDKLEDEQNINDSNDCKNVETTTEILTNAKSSILMAQTLPNDMDTLVTAARNDDDLPTCTPDLVSDDCSHHSSFGITVVPRHLDREGNQEQLDEEALTNIVDSEDGDDDDQSVETHDAKDNIDDDQPEGTSNEKIDSKPKIRNSAWRAMLEKDKEKDRKKKGSALVEEEAEEEEEEQVAGLEDFGFTVNKKRKEDGDEADDASLDEDDLEHVVDELSDDEGDEEAGDVARKAMEKKEEKERHKEMLRRLRDGYDGRRGGIAAANGARGVHRFDQLVAADNKDDAKRLGLANDDEFDSDSDDDEKKNKKDKGEGGDNTDDEDDEAALIDKMLKDRFLHRNNNEDDAEQENFSEDENEDEDNKGENEGDPVDEEEKEQERVAKRFAKRARMQRLLEAHEHDQEFSQMKLIEEDTSFKLELQMMRNGLARKRSTSSSQPSIINSVGASSSSSLLLSSSSTGTIGSSSNLLNGQDENSNPNKKQKTNINNEKSDRQQQNNTLTSSIFTKGGCLALALQNNRTLSKRTSFIRTSSTGSSATGSSTGFGDTTMASSSSSYMKSIAFNHVVFTSINDNNNNNSRSKVIDNSSNSSRLFPSSASSLHRPNMNSIKSKAIQVPSSSRESLFTRSVIGNNGLFSSRSRSSNRNKR